MIQNGVIETASGDLLRCGVGVDFNDAAFQPGTQSIRTDVPFPGLNRGSGSSNMDRWNGAAWVQVPNVTIPKAALGSVFSAYDSLGGQSFSTTPTVLNLDTVALNMDSDVYDLASDELTINQGGEYEFSFDVTADATTGTRDINRAWLEQDSGGGYAEVTGTRNFGYHRNTAAGENTGSTSLPVSVNAGDKFRIMVMSEGGNTLVTVADASRLTVRKLEAA